MAPLRLLTKTETVPQRLKPRWNSTICGTDKSVPFQNCGVLHQPEGSLDGSPSLFAAEEVTVRLRICKDSVGITEGWENESHDEKSSRDGEHACAEAACLR